MKVGLYLQNSKALEYVVIGYRHAPEMPFCCPQVKRLLHESLKVRPSNS